MEVQDCPLVSDTSILQRIALVAFLSPTRLSVCQCVEMGRVRTVRSLAVSDKQVTSLFQVFDGPAHRVLRQLRMPGDSWYGREALPLLARPVG